MVTAAVQQWKPFKQHPQAKAIIEGLEDIPDDWALTPVREKKPYRDGWQSETPLSKEQIKDCIVNGEQLWSKEKEKHYHGYASGYGLRLGDASGGLIALDIDGASVQQLLNAIAKDELPSTPMWTSGKPGRYQILFQIPDKYREQLKECYRTVLTTWNGYHCQEGEQLEIRYNGHQSVLPFSYHPETGKYEWLMSPEETPVAIAPDWLIRLAIGELTDPAEPKLPDPPQQQPKQNRWELYLENFEYRSHESIPLINCLSRDHRDLVASGVGEGNRDNTAIAIAMDAVGCEQWLTTNGQAYEGSADEIIRDFCSRCCPPLGDKDINRIYKSAQKGSKGSAIAHHYGDDALKAVVASYFWDKEKGSFSKRDRATGKNDNRVNRQPKRDNNTAVDIKAEITNLISSGITGADLNLKINNLALECGYQPREVWGIYNAELAESERDRDTAKSETINLLNISKASIKLDDIVDNRLSTPLSKVAKMMGGKDEAVITSLLPVVASLVSTQSKLELIRSTGFYAYPIIFTGIVGESGTAKSPLQKLVLKPLWNLQDALEQDYRARLQEWEEMEVGEGEKKPPKPTPLDLWTADVTSERVAEIMSNQKDENQGLLIWKDELSALIKDNDAYRGGKGSDAEKLLSGRDGSPLKVDRCSKRLSVPQSSYSITGGIQPDTLKQQIDFSDPTGHWARFLLCYLPLTKRTFPDDEVDIDVNDYLKGVYQNIRSQAPQTYTLSSEAKAKYRDWYNQLGELAYGEARQGLRNVYSKMTRDTGVIALLLHCLNAAIAGEEPESEISASTLSSAINLTKFYIGQVKLIHAEGDAEDGELSPLYIKILSLSERKGWVKAKDLKMSDRSFRKMNANDIRSLFTELEAMGLGTTHGKGNRLMFNKAVDAVDAGCQSVDKTVNQSETPNNGENIHKNNMVDTDSSTFSPPTANSSGSNSSEDKTNLVDNLDDSTKGSDNRDNQNDKTPTSTESESVDSVSTACQPVLTTDNQNEETPTTNSSHDEKLAAIRDYLRRNGESDQMVVAIECGFPSGNIKELLEPIAEITRCDQFTCYWKLKE